MKKLTKTSDRFDQVDKEISNLQTDVSVLKTDVSGIKSSLETLNEKFDALGKQLNEKLDRHYTIYDKFAGEVLGYRQEQTTTSGSLSTHSDTLEKHETRISELEKHARISPAL